MTADGKVHGPGSPEEFDPAGQSNQVAGVAGNPSVGNSGEQSIRQLGLYGQLPEAGAQHASTTDSPDNLTHVTFAFEGSDFDPAVDPTGQWLVYASTQHRQTADLYLKRVNGTTVTQLTNDAGNHVMPTFSPDGKRIAFASDRGGAFAIYVMDVEGGQPVQITNDNNDNIHPSFSHDGKQLVYCSHGGQSGQWEMVVVDVDNPASKHFIGHGLFPTFSPVDNRILFQRARERGSRWFSIWTIELIDGEGLHPTEIAASANAALITPAWSPDGKHIAFCTVLDPGPEDHSRPEQADIWIIGDDGTGRANLTHSAYSNLQPVWAHNGTIYFTSNRGKEANENVWSIHPDRTLQVASRSDGNEGAMGHSQSADGAAAAPAMPRAMTPQAPAANAPGSTSAGAAGTGAHDQAPVSSAGQSDSPAARNDATPPTDANSSASVPVP